MESTNYEKYISEIQLLRKQISAEKLAHENTLKQLHSTYEIIDEIKDALRAEQNSNAKLKADLNQATSNLTAMAHQYEGQIAEIKELLTVKDEELRRINAYLRVNDADIIRMKVVNELQLDHAEKVEALSEQLLKKSTEIAELRSNQQLLLEKHEVLQRQTRSQQQEVEEKRDQLTHQYMDELKTAYEQLERERAAHNKWEKKHELLQARFAKQADLYKAEMQKLSRELQDENKSLLSNSEAKLNKHKLEKMEDSLAKLKEELNNEKENAVRLDNELTRTRKELKDVKKINHDQLLDKERSQEEIEQLKIELTHKDAQHKKNIATLQKEMENKADNASFSLKGDKDKVHSLETELRKITLRLQQLQIDNQLLREQAVDKNLAKLKRELSEKEEEMESLRQEVRTLKKKEGERKRTASVQEKKEEGVGHLKAKLQEANAKIVELLREKIELKQQVSSLQAK